SGSRQNAQGQTYAVDYIRQQVIAAVGWDRAMNEGFRIHTTIDVDLQTVAEDFRARILSGSNNIPITSTRLMRITRPISAKRKRTARCPISQRLNICRAR